MVDREINKEGLCVSQIVANNDQGAQAAAEALVEATGGKGDYAELLGLESIQTARFVLTLSTEFLTRQT